VFVELFDPTTTDEAEDLTIEYPLSQRGARVFVTGGLVSTSSVEGGVSEKVQALPVGVSKLASEVADITQYNAIVVGGPCANPIAAQLMGNPEPCWESIAKGVAKVYEHANGNVALLAAGRSGQDTRRVARALATGQIASVNSMEAEISGTTMTDISVKAV
jgi:S-layer protein (TIGR01564 family)